jgi:hypothetical protein
MMAHHKHGPICPLCEEKKKEAHYLIAEWFDAIKAEIPDAHISCTFRSKADQEKAVEEKKSKAHWPTSAHNHMRDGKPCARAMDLFRLTPGGSASFARDFYQDCAKVLDDQCAPLFWGYDQWGWDLPHFQLKKDVL